MDRRLLSICLVFSHYMYGFSPYVEQRITTVIQRTGIDKGKILPTFIILENAKEAHNDVLDLFSLVLMGMSYAQEFDTRLFEEIVEDLHIFVKEYNYEYQKALFLLMRECVRSPMVTLKEVSDLLKESKSLSGAWKYYILSRMEGKENEASIKELLEKFFLLPGLKDQDVFLSLYMINNSLGSLDTLFIKKYVDVLLQMVSLQDMTLYEWNVMIKSFYSMEALWQKQRSNLVDIYTVFLQFHPDPQSLADMSKSLTALFSLEDETHQLSAACKNHFMKSLTFKHITLEDHMSFLTGLFLLSLKDDIKSDTVQSVFEFVNDAADIPIMEGKDLNLFGLFLQKILTVQKSNNSFLKYTFETLKSITFFKGVTEDDLELVITLLIDVIEVARLDDNAFTKLLESFRKALKVPGHTKDQLYKIVSIYKTVLYKSTHAKSKTRNNVINVYFILIAESIIAIADFQSSSAHLLEDVLDVLDSLIHNEMIELGSCSRVAEMIALSVNTEGVSENSVKSIIDLFKDITNKKIIVQSLDYLVLIARKLIMDKAINDAALCDTAQTIIIALEKGAADAFVQALSEVTHLTEKMHGTGFVKESKKKLLNIIVVTCVSDYLLKYHNRKDENIHLGLMNKAIR